MKQKTVVPTTYFFFPLLESSGVYCFHHENVKFAFFDTLYLRNWLLSCLTELSSIINNDDDDDDDDDGGGGGGGERWEGIQI